MTKLCFLQDTRTLPAYVFFHGLLSSNNNNKKECRAYFLKGTLNLWCQREIRGRGKGEIKKESAREKGASYTSFL